MQITLEKYPPERGRKKIMVDGVQWGTVEMVGHGCHGPSYHFIQEGDTYWLSRITEGGYDQKVSVRGPRKHDLWKMETGRMPAETLEDRLLKTINELIAEGLLKHPEVYKASLAKWQAEVQERIAKADQEKRERDLQAAEDILAKIVPHLVEHVTLKEAIADAIEAGRSQ